MTHAWTRFTQQDVDVIVAPDGQPFVVDRPDEPTGEMVACSNCGETLNIDVVPTQCTPPVPAL